ncbi:MAG: hypothetical protein B9J98_02925 [Candidatus Terraquivivens tikiterensis]|uniref:MPN domain-containing protein n=1 Tax=Candidatus Terraquivivens tikiterensis TaxID=1980982 RepID=A0A2R7Y682_9ARCH|nr:MAG: hypothetical protein B9J98_02925 [Candidatus Terraquivivens tikiterensis]
MTLVIGKAKLDEIIRHALETYPEECCGLLVGKKRDDECVVNNVVRSRNVYEGDRRSRYVVDPLDVYKVEKDAEGLGLMLIGVYHSHPNYPARPSAYDAEVAWPYMRYLIVSVYGGRSGNVTAWLFDKKANGFIEEKIIIL